ncbi:multidrug efflux MFS transporter MdtH [Xenorhabdus szentirmaii]|uniref:Multidrug resistance protein MdtH n=2 Tax=Xenorhabdus szentirmaii TaxID=290112 RepID=W1IVX3_9GAMM|nr:MULTISPECIES: multidrug efflux MFS transporter MdtH [Xenorhabdus]MBD2781153.1 multidrug efflux MFS transporter MdtH [Xenorhabdus sp. 38]MBD2793131.1 multidrug efflux MFS transporter MdtH [Xenorhabdus sp. CUL]MBD2801221.1 multidrug efflux MFS transporter MdtH [Xenorhabdus sp. M]MBD2805964.1 multidrug efflux MFS transporter MdtH [Xenorhabdus sp. ZM]MBD2819345.1 multidrug efflux MFS transporter MdtH [Xenorhabdus sp. 42]
MSLVSQARSLGKYFLLFDNLIVVLGFFVVFPLISIRFVEQLGWAAAIVGFSLGLRQLVQQGLGIFGGAIADRFGAKPMIVTGMLLRASGFALMAMASEPWILILSCMLSGLGGTLFDPPRAALIIKLTRPHERGRFYSILLMQDSAGAVIGALVGSWLLQYNFNLVCWIGASIFVLAALFNACFLPAYRISTIRTPIKEGMGRVIKDRRFFYYVLTLTGYFILSVQVMLMFPIIIYEISGTHTAVRWMYAIEAVISLTLLYPIARWSEKHFRQEQRLMAGLFLMSICMFPIGWINQLHLLFGLISLFYLGMVTAEPAREMLSASLTDPRARGSYMGFSRLGLAFGGVLGYTGGGWLYDTGRSMDIPQLPWFLLGFVGIVTVYTLHHQFNLKKIDSIMVSRH